MGTFLFSKAGLAENMLTVSKGSRRHLQREGIVADGTVEAVRVRKLHLIILL